MEAPMLVLLLSACVSAELPNLTSLRENEPFEKLELHKREAPDNVLPKEDSIEEVNAKSGVADGLFQGDIVLTKLYCQNKACTFVSREQKERIAANMRGARFRRQAFNDKGWPARKWSNGIAYMLYLDDEKTKTAFQKAAKLWMENTCINFTEYKTKPPTDFLYVIGGDDGCKSNVGRNKDPGPQELALGQGCGTIGHAAHEIGHTLGLFHTHTRHDRDDFIKINEKNIKPFWRDQFDVQTTETNNNYDLTYDYGSIMHYAAESDVVSVDRKQPVMEAIDGNYTETLGSDIISFYDLLIMNTLYDCIGKTYDM
ncbi:astacin [Teladorsagia circumcincta]|uniref:Metalloendopeptidase n=1 Tax=Teladorsagia circumcincta TaxID=45464 RepID=A0A2G9U149_TELCI|nr:astacin [Teladorsagia circumcincta]